ncbi:ABC transporter ATP-binding protein [Roseovarius sp. SCSIO 43702]|uniref:ABC transporter ATP-binding protein n=1 Tax=Roseovarius sp. SCSIO 43702 TaxID=2823043 RepID=UPI001C73B4DE|nr:ABC transporter ATP-binding protein [Roseovarius sp. SCSIO 43702]QYX57187.1 ABC transporter ATP-binding protein [Roseovarius sp. SCSIO 43702]
MTELLSVDKLRVGFRDGPRIMRAVDGVSFSVDRGRTLGVVGESGCGKSIAMLAIMGLVPQPPGIIQGGKITFDGQSLLDLSKSDMRKIKGGRIGMIFQEPMTSLNPVYTCGDQIIESLRAHNYKGDTRARAIELLDLVGLPSPNERVDDYPHQLSGGQRQRVMIAMALANDPELLIADEPTTALDVTIQAQILDLIRELQKKTGMAVILVTHDLGVVAETCDDVVVIYAGTVVERAPAEDLFENPQHPYTIGLMAAVPRIDDKAEKLATIPGTLPPPWQKITGCRFAPRCPLADERCRSEEPPLAPVGDSDHLAACWYAPIDERETP